VISSDLAPKPAVAATTEDEFDMAPFKRRPVVIDNRVKQLLAQPVDPSLLNEGLF
jgi:hypothetical protein